MTVEPDLWIGSAGLAGHLAAALDRLGDGITVQDASGAFVYVNDTAARLCGFGSAGELMRAEALDVLGRFEVLDEEGRLLPIEELASRRALRGEEPAEQLIQVRMRSTGTLSWSLVQSLPMRDETGTVAYVVNLFRDVTERLGATRRLRFQAEASALLSSSLDYEQILVHLAQLAVPPLADWCVVYVVDDDGSVRLLTRAHGDPDRIREAEETYRRYPGAGEAIRQVIATGEPMLVREVTPEMVRGAARDDEHLRLLEEANLRSFLAVPLAGRDRTFGALALVSAESGRLFGEDDLELAADLGRRAAGAIENAFLLRDTEAVSARVAIQNEVARVLAEGIDEARTVEHTLELVCRRTGWDAARLQGADGEGAVRELESWFAPDLTAAELRTLHGDESPIGEALAGRAQWLPAVDGRSVLAVPVPVGDRAAAVLELLSRGREEPSAPVQDLLVAIARQLGLFLERTHVAQERELLLASEQQARAEAERAVASLRKLEQVAEAALSHFGTGDLLDELLRQITVLIGADTSLILLLDDERRFLTVRAAYGFDRELEHARPIPHGGGMAGRVASSGKPVLIHDLDQVELASPHLRERGISSLVAIPLRVDDRVIGVAHAGSVQPDYFDADDLRLLELMSDRLALAISQMRLFEAEREARREAEEAHRRLSFLAEASTILAASLDYEQTLQALARMVVPHLADWCTVDVVDQAGEPSRVALAHARIGGRELERLAGLLRRPDLDDPLGPGAVLRTGVPEFLPEIGPEVLGAYAGDPAAGAALEELGFASSLCVPMHGRDRVLGAIAFGRGSAERGYREGDLALAEELARRAAVAVENALLYRQVQERAQAARVLAAVGDGVFLVDDQGVIRLWNPAAEAITGLRRDAVLDRPAEQAIPGWAELSPRIPVTREGGSAVARAETVPFEIDGRELWLAMSGVGFADGTVYAFRDLTQDRALEELKGEFVSTVSHELRTPLAAVYGAAMTLQRVDLGHDPAQQRKLLGVIARESERLTSIVNDILWASRLDSDVIHLAIESCDARRLAEGVLEAAEVHRPEGIELELRAPEDLPLVHGDPDKIRQVLVNLIDNAVKYSPDGGRVTVELAAGDASLRFAVHDDGLGVPPAEQRRIFEKFYRLDPNLTRGVGGTGLGLYICRELVHRMEGRIGVVSPRPGRRGSTFFFELPLAGHGVGGGAQGSPASPALL